MSEDNAPDVAGIAPIPFDGKALGVRMKMLRDLRGLSLEAVGKAAGLTKSHVWELEKGRAVNPTVNAVWGLSAALCVSPSMLLGLDDKMPPIDPVAMKIAGIVDREIKRALRQHLMEKNDVQG
ncbi:helix-turn-helix domain-containing protein [Rhizorhabdus histidinilytica]|uniref:helix-turn-helix domain-containing protein n=1 Tax=Rhizorhabdus histidinilytica TaxID=439228 RepID=UPI00321F923F